MTILLIVLEVLTRLAAVATLLAIPRDPRVAAVIALASAASALLRAFVRGAARSRELAKCWGALIEGIRARDVRDLAAIREDEESVAMLSNAASEVAVMRSMSMPELIADAVSLAVLIGVAATRVPALWMLAAALVATPLALMVRASQRRQFAALQKAYATHGTLTRDTRALIEASAELRAQGCETSFAVTMKGLAQRMAGEEERALRYSAILGIAPIGLAVVALILPTDFAHALIQKTGLLDIGIVGGALLATALGLTRSIEAVRRVAPFRAALARLTMRSKTTQNEGKSEDRLALNEIRFDALSVVHPGSNHATPYQLTATLARGGLALIGKNGSGKSSAVAALLGLVPATTGGVAINGSPLDDQRSRTLNRSVSYLPQSPFVSAGDTLGWHADIVGSDRQSLLDWLDCLGLTVTLQARVTALSEDDRQASTVLDLKMGSLSGGEQQRFFLARAFARHADLLILDEPEAALDAEAREALGVELERIAQERLVIVIAHDVGFVPASFARVECVSRQIETATAT